MASSDYKKFNREIKGYVEVTYDIGYFDARFPFYIDGSGNRQILGKKQYSEDFVSIDNAEKNKPEYAMLYNDFTKLDGSFMLFNKTSNNCGYISEYTPKEIYDMYYTSGVDNSGKMGLYLIKNGYTSGVTIYTRNNKIINATIDLTYATQGVVTTDTIIIENNNKDILFIELDNMQESVQISIVVDEWEDENMLVNLLSVDGGLSYVYEGNELIDFEITEEVNKLVEETPSNELKLTIGDYEGLYDPLNPEGIAKYLTEGSKFIPYIGIRTEEGYFDYEKMGTFYFNKIDYNEKEVMLTCYNFMDKLSKQKIKNTNNTLNPVEPSRYNPIILKDGLSSYLENYILYNLEKNYEINISNKIRMVNNEFKDVTFSNFFQNASVIDGIFYIDRNDKIVIRKIDEEIKNSILKNSLLKDIQYINVSKIDKIELELNSHSISSLSGINDENNFTYEFVLEKETETVCISSDEITNIYGIGNSDLTITGATSYNVICPAELGFNVNNYIIFITINGQIGSNISIIAKHSIPRTATYNRITRTYGDGKNIIQMDNPFYNFYLNSTYDDTTFSNFFDKAYSYKVELEYNGDATIKAGDYIEVESNYGMVPIFVQKHTLKYNGGLSGTIEGVE